MSARFHGTLCASIGVSLITLGSTFLLAANLISTRKEKEEAKAPDADRVVELTTAAQVIAIALDHAKTMNVRPNSPGT